MHVPAQVHGIKGFLDDDFRGAFLKGEKAWAKDGSFGWIHWFQCFFGRKAPVRPLQGINMNSCINHIPPIETEMNLQNHFGKDDKIYICSFLGGESRLMTYHELVPVSMIH